jgi:regulation of enolase protein 1 (concanavalin A-like superfamily)
MSMNRRETGLLNAMRTIDRARRMHWIHSGIAGTTDRIRVVVRQGRSFMDWPAATALNEPIRFGVRLRVSLRQGRQIPRK